MWSLNLPFIPVAAVDPSSHQPLGEGRAIALVDYGPEDHAYFVVIMDAGPVLWIRTDNARRARNWSAGYDPGAVAGTAINQLMAQRPNNFRSMAEELATLPGRTLQTQLELTQKLIGPESLSAELWEEALLIHAQRAKPSNGKPVDDGEPARMIVTDADSDT